jgi:NADH-quinone oxidoreductase subunit L
MSPVFYVGTWALHLKEAQIYFIAIALVGAFTCFLAASQALVSVELKKILAYSTVSQIGYMMLGLGLSGFTEEAYIAGLTAGVYHLASHAMFKAALFLGAGAVIHAIHTIYTFNMGGLKKHMPRTYWLMVLATLSLSGVPIFSGFWSKDSVFLAALVAGTPLAYALLAVGVISAAMTFAYSIRYISNTFLHKESEFIREFEDHGHHIHEAPRVMWAPILILVVLFCITGILGFAGLFWERLNPEIFIEHQMHYTVEHLLPHDIAEHLHIPHIGGTTKLIGAGLSAVALAIGGFLGYNFYWTRKWNSWEWVQSNSLRKSIHNFLWNRWYMNDFYYRVFVDGILQLKQIIYDGVEAKILIPIGETVASITQLASNIIYNIVEENVIFGFINKGIPSVVISFYHQFKKSQTGLLSINLVYIVFLLLSIIILLLESGGI